MSEAIGVFLNHGGIVGMLIGLACVIVMRVIRARDERMQAEHRQREAWETITRAAMRHRAQPITHDEVVLITHETQQRNAAMTKEIVQAWNGDDPENKIRRAFDEH